MSRKRLIFYIVMVIAGICLNLWMDDLQIGFQKGDTIRVTTDTFVSRNRAVADKLGQAIIHEDKMSILQYMNDDEVRFVQPGTQGRVIMASGALVEIRLEDDGLRNWYVPKEFIEKIE